MTAEARHQLLALAGSFLSHTDRDVRLLALFAHGQLKDSRRHELIERARTATGELRDAAREGRVIEFRKRDELVMAIHDALDLMETADPRRI